MNSLFFNRFRTFEHIWSIFRSKIIMFCHRFGVKLDQIMYLVFFDNKHILNKLSTWLNNNKNIFSNSIELISILIDQIHESTLVVIPEA